MNERKRMREGLSCFVAGLVGKKILVELRGDKYVYGVLESCDCYLNVRMKNAEMDEGGIKSILDYFFIRGRHIRFIHMENYTDVVKSVRRGILAKKN